METGRSKAWGLRAAGVVLFVLIAFPLVAVLIGMASEQWMSWFFAAVASRLSADDIEGLSWVRSVLEHDRPVLMSGVAVLTFLALLLVADLWHRRARRLPALLALLSILGWTIGQGAFVSKMAEGRSYASFMKEVTRTVGAGNALYLYGGEFDPAPLFFYRGAPLPFLPWDADKLTKGLEARPDYVIMTEREWLKTHAVVEGLPPPLLKSAGKGSEEDARLVLIQGKEK